MSENKRAEWETHTPEPWSVSLCSGPAGLNGSPSISAPHKGTGNKFIADVRRGWLTQTDRGMEIDRESDGEGLANAHRIADCVNALAGVRNPAAVKELIAAVEKHVGECWGCNSLRIALSSLTTAPETK